jgi:2-dehydro-3-deoxyphosphogluconate aldolase/(4S)-4-hydroxy-2-oxoglutarate aldolase
MSAHPAPEEAVARVLEVRLIAVMRGFTPGQAVRAGKALAAGGARVLEVSLVDPEAIASIGEMRRELGDECLVGAGTVLTESQAEAALEAGADFLFSLGLERGVLEAARERGRLAIPGVLTPGEVSVALRLGVPLVKLFPAEPLGPLYLRQLLGPFPQLRVVPTGGIGAGNASAYMEAGAVALGAGTSLADPEWARTERYDLFEHAAHRFLRCVADPKGAR